MATSAHQMKLLHSSEGLKTRQTDIFLIQKNNTWQYPMHVTGKLLVDTKMHLMHSAVAIFHIRTVWKIKQKSMKMTTLVRLEPFHYVKTTDTNSKIAEIDIVYNGLL